LWGYGMVKEVEGRIPTISFSMEGDVFAPTGINQERLWLHYNYLPVWDEPEPGKPHVPGYVFLTEALEVCRTLGDVEALLNETHRDGGMMLFAVDGKTNDFAVFECMCAKHFRRDPSDGWIIGTNHYCACEDRTLGEDEGSVSTLNRFRRMQELVEALYAAPSAPSLPGDLIRMSGKRRNLVHLWWISGSQLRQLAAIDVAVGRVNRNAQNQRRRIELLRQNHDRSPNRCPIWHSPY
jgi:hypothetical protein